MGGPVKSRPQAEGSIAAIASISMTALLGFTALGVDLSLGWLGKKELQKGLDAATKGGAFYLDGTDEGVTAAKAGAVAIAAANTAAGTSIAIDLADVETGIYDGTFTVSTDAAAVNAIRIRHSVQLGIHFAGASGVGSTTINPAAQAIGTRMPYGASEAECYLPVAIPECVVKALATYGTTNLEDVAFIFGSSTENNAAWVSDDSSTPSASYLVNQIQSLEDGSCAGSTVSIGDPVGLNNGEIVPAINEMADAVNESTQTWDDAIWGTQPPQAGDWASYTLIEATNYGKIMEGPVLVVDVGDDYCTNGGPLSGTAAITGFIKGAVYDVMKGPGADKKSFVMRLNTLEITDERVASVGTAPDYGVVYYGTGNPL